MTFHGGGIEPVRPLAGRPLPIAVAAHQSPPSPARSPHPISQGPSVVRVSVCAMHHRLNGPQDRDLTASAPPPAPPVWSGLVWSGGGVAFKERRGPGILAAPSRPTCRHARSKMPACLRMYLRRSRLRSNLLTHVRITSSPYPELSPGRRGRETGNGGRLVGCVGLQVWKR